MLHKSCSLKRLGSKINTKPVENTTWKHTESNSESLPLLLAPPSESALRLAIAVDSWRNDPPTANGQRFEGVEDEMCEVDRCRLRLKSSLESPGSSVRHWSTKFHKALRCRHWANVARSWKIWNLFLRLSRGARAISVLYSNQFLCIIFWIIYF